MCSLRIQISQIDHSYIFNSDYVLHYTTLHVSLRCFASAYLTSHYFTSLHFTFSPLFPLNRALFPLFLTALPHSHSQRLVPCRSVQQNCTFYLLALYCPSNLVVLCYAMPSDIFSSLCLFPFLSLAFLDPPLHQLKCSELARILVHAHKQISRLTHMRHRIFCVSDQPQSSCSDILFPTLISSALHPLLLINFCYMF